MARASAAIAVSSDMMLVRSRQFCLSRFRRTIEAVAAGSLIIRTIDGTFASIFLTGVTQEVAGARSSLDASREGVFLGTATNGDDPPRAPEIRSFPESMRSTGEGHRDWYVVPDTLAGGGRVRSVMTDGTVKISARSIDHAAVSPDCAAVCSLARSSGRA